MTTKMEVEDVLHLVANRVEVLTLLEGTRLQKREIVEELDYSRSTVNRVITRLATAGLVDDAPSGCQTTFVGSLIANEYSAYRETVEDVLRAQRVLTSLPPDTDLPSTVFADAEVVTPAGPRPYEPYHAVEDVLRTPGPDGAIRVYVPAFSNPRGLELAQQLARTVPLEIVFSEELVAELTADLTDGFEALVEHELFSGYCTADGPRYTLIVADAESETKAAIVMHTADRNLSGVLVTSNPEALRWIDRRYAEIKAESDPLEAS